MEANLADPGDAARPTARPPAEPAAASLLSWYDRHARRLPWRVGPRARRRGEHADPYRVWLSEIMLQQTTVKAVAPYYERFLARWPTLADLAAADEADIMRAWAGLGYYSRARNLVACAAVIAKGPDGAFPNTAAGLRALPGIGAYTSAAIAAIAFGEPVAVVDGNVERVIARVFGIAAPLPAAKAEIGKRLDPLVPRDRPGEFAEALMDLGATICTPKSPACGLCPWSEPCAARREGLQAVLPVKAAKKERPVRFGTAYVARRADGAVLVRRRPPKGLLGGMTEVPGSDWAEALPPSAPPLVAAWTRLAVPVIHGFTHFELRVGVERADVPLAMEAPEGMWFAPAATLAGEALPNLMRKIVEAAVPGATLRTRE